MSARFLTGVLAAALLLAGGSTAAKVRPSPSGLKLYAMDCGTYDIPNADAFADDGAYTGWPRAWSFPAT